MRRLVTFRHRRHCNSETKIVQPFALGTQSHALLSRNGDVGSVCRNSLRTLAQNVLLAFALPWLQRCAPKSQLFDTWLMAQNRAFSLLFTSTFSSVQQV